MASKCFMMTLSEDILNIAKDIARERSFKEKKDYTYQDILRECLGDKFLKRNKGDKDNGCP
jgi:hypothetical protein